MKTICNFALLICFFLFCECSNNPNKSAGNIDLGNNKSLQIKTKEDSMSIKCVPSSQEIYSFDSKRVAIIGKLKRGPTTKISEYKSLSNDSSLESRVALYYINKRIVRIESRIYDISGEEQSFSIFDFDEDNNCISNTQWSKKDLISYTFAIYNKTIIYYDVDNNLISIDESQKKQMLQNIKVSLDDIMKHFSDYNYKFTLM